MNAHDIMTRAVVSVAPETPIPEIARLLHDHNVSAVPVVDRAGAPVGMVSEGDLIGRGEDDREARRDWWLDMIAEGETLNDEFLSTLKAPRRTGGDIMTAPVVTVTEETDRLRRCPIVTGLSYQTRTRSPRRPHRRYCQPCRSGTGARRRSHRGIGCPPAPRAGRRRLGASRRSLSSRPDGGARGRENRVCPRRTRTCLPRRQAPGTFGI